MGIPYIEKYLGVFTSGKVNSTKLMSVSICGEEEVQVINEGNPKVFNLQEGGETQEDYTKWFKSTDDIHCPISSYSLLSSSMLALSDKEAAIISIKNGTLTIN